MESGIELEDALIESGSKFWRNKQGLYHRVNGPAIEWRSGTKEWYINGIRHREDGSAIEYFNGEKYWYINNELHREDGPAIEYPNGEKWWCFHGKFIDVSSQEEFERLLKLRMFW